MKRTLPVLLGSLVMAAPGALPAQDLGDYTWTTNADNTITITLYSGSDSSVIIPSEVTGLPVTGIGAGAFEGSGDLTNVTIPNSVSSIGVDAFADCALTSVTIPNSVTSIGLGAFSPCLNLTAITVNTGNPNYSSVGGVLFNKKQTTLIQCPEAVARYTIPKTVTNIATFAFGNCFRLASLTIPDSVTGIGVDAFVGCAFTSVTIPKSVTSIGEWAFADCTNLTAIAVNTGNPDYSSVGGALFNKNQTTLIEYPDVIAGDYTIPNSVTSVANAAFWVCPYLTSVTIPSSVTSIGDLAFIYCTGLTSIAIPNSVTNIGAAPFAGCGLTAITVNADNPAYRTVDGALFTKNMTTLVEYCGTETTYSIPDTVTSVGAAAFYATGLTGVTIPSSVTSIGDLAFAYCFGLTSLTIPSSVTSIGAEAFYYCGGLTGVYFEGDAPTVGTNAFGGGGSLSAVYYEPGTSGWGATFGGVPTSEWNTVIFSADPTSGEVPLTVSFRSDAVDSGGNAITDWNWSFGDGSTSTAQNPSHTYTTTGTFSPALIAANDVGGAVIGSGPALIAAAAPQFQFTYATNSGAITITGYNGSGGAMTIPSTIDGLPVRSIGEAAFESCPLTSVTIPRTMVTIGDYAFAYCNNLTTVSIPNSVTTIGDGAFSVSGLTNVTIPFSVTNIGQVPFDACTNLTAISVDSGNLFYSSTNGVLFDKSQRTLCEFPGGLGGSYAIPNSVANIAQDAFIFCLLSSVTIPGSVIDIGADAFYGCDSVTAITVDTNNAFYSSLNGALFDKSQRTLIRCPGAISGSFEIPARVAIIEESAFMDCAQLASVTIPNTVSNIGYSAFWGCSGLTSVTLPNSLRYVPLQAFMDCTNVGSAIIPNGVATI